MRTWIYNRIKAAIEAAAGMPANLKDRIISSGSADNPTPPFIVVSMGVEQPPLGMPASSRTQQIPFTAWVHDKPGSMVAIDDIAKTLKDALPTDSGAVVGNMSVLGCIWTDTGEDAFDDHYNTNTRPVRFMLTTRR
jgi:hypothetical protein